MLWNIVQEAKDCNFKITVTPTFAIASAKLLNRMPGSTISSERDYNELLVAGLTAFGMGHLIPQPYFPSRIIVDIHFSRLESIILAQGVKLLWHDDATLHAKCDDPYLCHTTHNKWLGYYQSENVVNLLQLSALVIIFSNWAERVTDEAILRKLYIPPSDYVTYDNLFTKSFDKIFPVLPYQLIRELQEKGYDVQSNGSLSDDLPLFKYQDEDRQTVYIASNSVQNHLG